jgi:hypothetical protein
MPDNPQEHAGSQVHEQVQYVSGRLGPSCYPRGIWPMTTSSARSSGRPGRSVTVS